MRFVARNIRVFALGVLFTAGSHAGVADEPQDKILDSEEGRLSYSLGHEMGVSVKKQQLGMDVDLYLRGMRDVLTETEPPMREQEMRELITTYWKNRKQKVQQERKELAEKNLKTGREFLAGNANKEGVVVLPSGLQYQVIRTGNGKNPGGKDRVSIHYRGTLIDGTEFGSSYERDIPFSFQVEAAVPGQVEALKLMHEGDKWRLFIPTELAYGERGRRGLVGPNETLVFEVELLSINAKESEPAIAPPKPVDAAKGGSS